MQYPSSRRKQQQSIDNESALTGQRPSRSGGSPGFSGFSSFSGASDLGSSANSDLVSILGSARRRRPATPEEKARLARKLVSAEAALMHQPKRRQTALLLCVFLGWLGCHRYYVGKLGTGRLYLFTGGLLLVGVVLDTFLILSGSFEDQFGRPLE